MPALTRHGINNRLPQLRGQLVQLLRIQTLDVIRPADFRQNRHRQHLPQFFLFFFRFVVLRSKRAIVLPTNSTMFALCSIAMDLPAALPPIINADVNAAISTEATAVGNPIAAPIEVDN